MFLLLERVVICMSNTHCNDFWRSVIEIAAIILIQIAFKICFLYGNNQPDNNYLESSNDLILNHKQATNQPNKESITSC